MFDISSQHNKDNKKTRKLLSKQEKYHILLILESILHLFNLDIIDMNVIFVIEIRNIINIKINHHEGRKKISYRMLRLRLGYLGCGWTQSYELLFTLPRS